MIAGSAQTLPHNNLPPCGLFLGRAAEKALVHQALRSATLVNIDGPEGIGKTALALSVAWDCLRAAQEQGAAGDVAVFEGIVWLGAADGGLTLARLLDTVARIMNRPSTSRQPLSVKLDAVCDLLERRPCLLVVDSLDRVADRDVDAFLCQVPAPSVALTTACERKLLDAWPVVLKRMVEAEGVGLIRAQAAHIGLTSVAQADARALLRLYQATHGIPLAIKWAVGQIGQVGLPLEAALGHLPVGGDVMDGLWARAWALLSPDAQRVLQAMALLSGSATRASLEAVSGVGGSALEAALAQLTTLALVEATGEPETRYGMHPLVRDFVVSAFSETPAAADAARERLARFYAAWQDRPVERETWEAELLNILPTVRWCWAQRQIALGAAIFFGVADGMAGHGFGGDVLALCQEGMAAAAAGGDDLNLARLRVWFVRQQRSRREDFESAWEQLAQTLEVFERSGDAASAARARLELGAIAFERGEFASTEKLLKQALVYFQSVHDESMIYAVTARLGEVALAQGYDDAAAAMCRGVLASARQHGEPIRVADLLTVLSAAACRRGNLDAAQAFCDEAAGMLAGAERCDETAQVMFKLARQQIEAGQEGAARETLAALLEVYEVSSDRRVSQAGALLANLSGG